MTTARDGGGTPGRGDLVTGMSAFIFRWAILCVLWAGDFVTADLGLDNYAAAGAVSAFLAVVTVAAVLAMAREKFQQALLLTLLNQPDPGPGLYLVPGQEEAQERDASRSAARSRVLSLLGSSGRSSAAGPGRSPGHQGTG